MSIRNLHWFKLCAIFIVSWCNGLRYILVRNNKISQCIQYIFFSIFPSNASSFDMVFLLKKVNIFHVHVPYSQTCDVYHSFYIFFSTATKYESSE